MSNMQFGIRRFVDFVRKNPAQANDPILLKQLEQLADNSADGSQAALIAPMAPWTWETRVVLTGAIPQSARQPLIFPRPVDVLGFYPTVIPITNTNGLITPTVNDIDVSIDTNAESNYSAGSGASTAAGGSAGPFVTLAAMGVQIPRLMCISITAPSPDLGMTFKWKRGTGFYQDAFISVAVFARYRK